MSALNFTCPVEDQRLITQIVQRYVQISRELRGPDFLNQHDVMILTMDITACHCNACTLKLWQLLASDNSDFLHDILNIVRNIDRKTGKMLNGFRPRFST
jgi:hypothetical protein